MKSLLRRLSELNVRIASVDGKLQVTAAPGVLTRELQDQIRQHKDVLIARLQSSPFAHADDEPQKIVPDRDNLHQPFPLNDVQHAYWIGRQSNFDLGNVSTHFYFEVDAVDIDLMRLTDSFNRVIARHDMLRAITEDDGRQRILAEVPRYQFPHHDLTGMGELEVSQALEQLRLTQSQRVIASDRWPLFDIVVATIDERRARLSFSWDFIFLDAWSLLLIFDQWHKFYSDSDYRPQPLPISFRDYVLAECRLKEQAGYQASKQYWWDRIDRLPKAPALPVVLRQENAGRHKFNRRSFSLPAEHWSALKAFGRKAGLTPTSVLLTVFSEILNRWSASPHYCLNLTIFNRQPLHRDVNALVGDFTNLLVLEVDGRGAGDFVNKARRLQDQFLRDLNHKSVSAVEVVREMARRGGTQQRAILPVVFTSTLMIDGSRAEDTSTLERFGPIAWGISQTPQVWLDYQIFEFHGNLVLNWDTVDEAFAPGVLEDMFAANRAFIESLSSSQEAWRATDPLRLPAEQAARLVTYNSTVVPQPVSCLHAAFIEHALRDPARVALIGCKYRITYGELLARSTALAARLLAAGVKPNVLVAVVMEKGWEQFVAVLAIHIAGGAYLPVDPQWPVLRRNKALARMEVALVVVQAGALPPDLPNSIAMITVEYDDPDAAAVVTQAPALLQSPSDLAYVIFTSGSTGAPKGVMISHESAWNTVLHVSRLFGIGPDDRFIAVSDLGFDLSVYDIFGALGVGAAIVIPAAAQSKDADHWSAQIAEHRVTVWNSAPQLMGLLADHADDRQDDRLASLMTVMLSGDRIPVRLPGRIRNFAPGASTISLGGATEGAIWSIYYRIGEVDPRWEAIPYGQPLPNQTMHVLNKLLEPCPELVTGDIYIGGAGVALGYWRDDEKTSLRFIRHPLTNERLYWTGDLGRMTSDGYIEFLGREDSQVKLRGYRVELGEIAAHILACESVADALVQVVRHGKADVLVAYLVVRASRESATLAAQQSFSLPALVDMLADSLPDYMVPQRFFVLDAFPLTPNGKVDTTTLPGLGEGASNADRIVVAPGSSLEARILAIWKEVLGVDALGVTDNFFEAGGDSLSLTLVLRKLNHLDVRKVSIAELFSYSTVRALAGYLTSTTQVIALPAPVRKDNIAHDIAVIGMSGRFPDADDPDELWSNISDGLSAIRQFTVHELIASGIDPRLLERPDYVRAGVVLDKLDQFDADFFKVPASEAAFMDPQQRFLIEGAYHALEQAGYVSEEAAGRIGMFVGKGVSRYMIDHLLARPEVVEKYGMFTILNGHEKDHAASVVSYRLNLTGPSLSINSSCATSLANLHVACQSLRNGECELAVAGAVSFMSTHEKYGYVHEEGGVTSPDGQCRSFADDANGSLYGSGFGLVVLKPLAQALKDRDTIHAVIKGSAINNDGGAKQSYAAPGLHGQAGAISAAHMDAGVSAQMIDYVEAHGTGTNLGDQVEFAALRNVFGGPRADGSTVALGSVKPNIGHLDAAAGMASLIKVVQALRYKKLPPSLLESEPNQKIAFRDSPFFINTSMRDWPARGAMRLAGVNIFGVGGTNAHVVVEEAPSPVSRPVDNGPQLLVLSARTNRALMNVARDLQAFLAGHRETRMDDVAFTLQLGRKVHAHRAHVVCRGIDDAIAQLGAIAVGSSAVPARVNAPGAVVFVFPGMLVAPAASGGIPCEDSTAYRKAFGRCAQLVMEYVQLDLGTLCRDAQGAYGEVVNFSIQYSLAAHWMAVGVHPTALCGVGAGEYVAACLAGVFSLEEALALLVVRWQIAASVPDVRAVSVECSAAELTSLSKSSAWRVCQRNGANGCELVGSAAEIAGVESTLGALKIGFKGIGEFDLANTALIEPFMDVYRDCLGKVAFNAPLIPLISSTTGANLQDDEVCTVAYWADQFRRPLDLEAELRCLEGFSGATLLEIDQSGFLSSRTSKRGPGGPCFVASFGSAPLPAQESHYLHEAMGLLWTRGIDIDWASVQASGHSGRIPLPVYPFERARYWIESAAPHVTVAPVAGSAGAHAHSAITPSDNGGPFVEQPLAVLAQHVHRARPELAIDFVAPCNEIEISLAAIWSEYLGIGGVGTADNFFDLGGDSLMATRVYSRVKKDFGVELPMEMIFSLNTIKRLYLYIATTKNSSVVEDLSDEELLELEAIIAA
jgi:amino acid adenylation domain-containing protein